MSAREFVWFVSLKLPLKCSFWEAFLIDSTRQARIRKKIIRMKSIRKMVRVPPQKEKHLEGDLSTPSFIGPNFNRLG